MTNFPAAFDKEVILAVHSYSIKRFGGTDGIRDLDLLESSIAQPFQTFDGTDLYPSTVEKACRLAFLYYQESPVHRWQQKNRCGHVGHMPSSGRLSIPPQCR